MPIASLRQAGSIRLLIVEDEPHIRRVLVTLFEASGFQVEEVDDGTEALRRLRGDARYDLVVTDLMMPGASGLELLESVRKMEHRRDLPVVILTAKGQDTDRTRAFQLGANDFLTKPFSPKKLLARVDELVAPV